MNGLGERPNFGYQTDSMNHRRSLTQEVIGHSDVTGFSGTHSVLDWESLRRGALGAEEDLAAYRDLASGQVRQAPVKEMERNKFIYIEPLGNRCYDTRVFSSDDLDGLEEDQEAPVKHEVGDDDKKDQDIIAVDDRQIDEKTVDTDQLRSESKREKNAARKDMKPGDNHHDAEESLGTDADGKKAQGTKRKRIKSTIHSEDKKQHAEKRKYTTEELHLPSSQWKAYYVLDDSHEGKESMVYHSPEGIPCYSVEMMNAVERLRNKKINVEKSMRGLLRDVKTLRAHPLFTGVRPKNMGRDSLLLHRIGKVRKKHELNKL